MFWIVIVFLASGTQHSEYRQVDNELVCAYKGQEYAQDFLRDHPSWTLVQWYCECGRRV